MKSKLALNLIGLVILGAATVFAVRMPVGLGPATFDVSGGFQEVRFLDHEEGRQEWLGQKIQCLKHQELGLEDFRAYAAKYPAAVVASVDTKPSGGTKTLVVSYEVRYANEWVRDCTRSIQEFRPADWPNWAGVAKVDLDRGRGIAAVHPKDLRMDWVKLALLLITMVATVFSGTYWFFFLGDRFKVKERRVETAAAGR